MPQNDFETPAAAALAEFLARIERDRSLSALVKAGLREDLGSEKPTAFEKLASAIAAESKSK